MATTLHEWQCPQCGRKTWSHTKDKGLVFLKKVVMCRGGDWGFVLDGKMTTIHAARHAPYPMQGTGKKRVKHSLQELL